MMARVTKDQAEPAALPPRPPYALRGRLLTPIAAGGTHHEPDGVVVVDDAGLIAHVGGWAAWDAAGRPGRASGAVHDVRPWLILPGLVDLHAHLPQIPNSGLGSGLHLLDWLERYIFPLERSFDAATASVVAPAAFAAMARAGTTTAVLYGAAWLDSLAAAFAAAERHGIRAVIGKVMMDRFTYRDLPPERRLDTELRESAELCERWHGRDGGRLMYAFSPRFAVSCTAELLRESADLARSTGAYWQTHLSEDRNELAEVARLFPGARDYLDVYDRAGALGPRTILAHAIHLSDREIARLAKTGSRIAHCPESNLFLASGAMRLARYRAAGLIVGLGSDVAAGPSLSIFSVMRAGAYTHDLIRVTSEPGGAGGMPSFGPLDWLRLGTLDGARALGIDDRIGSLEPGKEADLIVIDHALTAPLPGLEVSSPEQLVSRLVFRSHPAMVRGAWVRGRLLPADPPEGGPVGP